MSVTLAELAIHIPDSIHLFERYDLDYYQNGKQTFKEACCEKGLPYAELDAELAYLQNRSGKHSLTLEDLSIDRLIDFINGQFHANETEILNFIHNSILQLLAEKSCDAIHLKMLEEVEQKFAKLKKKLIMHCEKEDEILFPYIRKLLELRRDKTSLSPQTISIIKNPIRILEAEHVQASQILADIKRTAGQFSIPADVPKEYVMLMQSLRKFEHDLHMHLHIENNILFPKLIALEEELNTKIKH